MLLVGFFVDIMLGRPAAGRRAGGAVSVDPLSRPVTATTAPLSDDVLPWLEYDSTSPSTNATSSVKPLDPATVGTTERLDGISTISATSRTNPSVPSSPVSAQPTTTSSGGGALPRVTHALEQTLASNRPPLPNNSAAAKLPALAGPTSNQADIAPHYRAGIDDLNSTNEDIKAMERVLERLRSALPSLEASSGGDAEQLARDRRQTAEETRALQIRAHRERLQAVHQRTEETVANYRLRSLEDKNELLEKQREVLKAALAAEREALTALQKQAQTASPDVGGDEESTVAKAAAQLEAFLLRATRSMRQDVVSEADDNLRRNLDAALTTIHADRINSITEGREARLRVFQQHKFARLERAEQHKNQVFTQRRMRSDNILGAIKVEWDDYLINRRIHANEAARNYDATLRDDFDRITKSSSQTIKHVVERQNALLRDAETAALKRVAEQRQSYAADMLHLQRLLDAERKALVQSTPAAADGDYHQSLVADFPEVDALSIHTRRLVDEVSIAIHAATLQSETHKVRKSVEEHELVVADLYRHVHGQRDTLMRDWLRVQHLISQLETDADLLAKRAVHGRSTLASAQQSVDATAGAWAAELRRMMSRCLAGGPDAYIQRGEDIAGQVLFQCNAKIRAIQRGTSNLMAARREVEAEIGDAQLLLDSERDSERSIVLDIVKAYEVLAREAEAVEKRAQKLAQEEAEIDASRRALRDEQVRIQATMERMQQMAAYAKGVTREVALTRETGYNGNPPHRNERGGGTRHTMGGISPLRHSSGSSRSTSAGSTSTRHVALHDKYRHLYDDERTNAPYGAATTTTSSSTAVGYPQQRALFQSSSSNDPRRSLTTPSTDEG